jgi:subtilisin
MTRVFLLIMFVLPVMAQAQSPQSDDQYIVTFASGTSQPQRAAAVQRAGAEVRFNYSIVNAVAIRVPSPNALTALRNDGSVVSIVPDRAVHAIEGIEDIGQNGKPGGNGGGGGSPQVTPEGVKRVGIPTAASNGAGIGVAIIDTGIDLAHKDLVVSPLQFSAFGGSCQDNNGHGTHVSGIVAARDNSIDVLGVAPQATLYCVKVLDSSGSGSDSDVMAGLQFVLQNAATASPAIRVVNMSLGRDGSVNDNPALRSAIQNLYNAGITVVVAAGNDASKEVKTQVPAGYPEVLAVASTSAVDGSNVCSRFSGVIKADTASYFTTDGAYAYNATAGGNVGVTISAPGEDQENISKGCLISSVGILSTKLGGGTTRLSGTSMASPNVAGIAARLIQTNTAWQPETIRTALRNSAQRVGAAPLDSPTSGYSFDGQREGVAKAP